MTACGGVDVVDVIVGEADHHCRAGTAYGDEELAVSVGEVVEDHNAVVVVAAVGWGSAARVSGVSAECPVR